MSKLQLLGSEVINWNSTSYLTQITDLMLQFRIMWRNGAIDMYCILTYFIYLQMQHSKSKEKVELGLLRLHWCMLCGKQKTRKWPKEKSHMYLGDFTYKSDRLLAKKNGILQK